MQIKQIHKKSRVITKLDLFLFILVLCGILIAGILVKYVFQKDTFVTVELLASGGEWWWGTPPPFVWNTTPLKKGAIEYDVLDKPLVEVLNVEKLQEDVRDQVLIRARIKVSENVVTKEYQFRQQKIEIGRTINISPDRISIVGTIVGIEGFSSYGKREPRIVSVVIHDLYQWEADLLTVGDVMKDNNGAVVAEVLEKNEDYDDFVAVTYNGEPLLKKNPLMKKVELKTRLMVNSINGRDLFRYNESVKPGEHISLDLSKKRTQVWVTKVENESAATK